MPFYSVATIDSGRGFSTIRRTARERVITVSADVDEQVANANEIMADLFEDFVPILLASHPGLQVSLEGEQREQALMGDGMVRLGIVSLLIIYILLAVPLRSYGQPIIIMAVIPFGLVGAIGGHLLLGKPLSMMSLMGVAALSGVVVNASLVLVHHVNARRSEGIDIREAVKMAGVAPLSADRPHVADNICRADATPDGTEPLGAVSDSDGHFPCIWSGLCDADYVAACPLRLPRVGRFSSCKSEPLRSVFGLKLGAGRCWDAAKRACSFYRAI